MGRKGFEQLLGFHAAPLFVGIKAACLLSFRRSAFEDFDALLAKYEPCLNCKGIEVFRVVEGEEFVLLLFYRPAVLWRACRMKRPGPCSRSTAIPVRAAFKAVSNICRPACACKNPSRMKSGSSSTTRSKML